MDDRELLELAAKAAKYQIVLGKHDSDSHVLKPDQFYMRNAHGVRHQWNPLTDDGDALRLAVKLHLALSCGSHMKRSWADRNDIGPFFGNWDMHEGDEDKAMRYAIVRAAAEIGRAMS